MKQTKLKISVANIHWARGSLVSFLLHLATINWPLCAKSFTWALAKSWHFIIESPMGLKSLKKHATWARGLTTARDKECERKALLGKTMLLQLVKRLLFGEASMKTFAKPTQANLIERRKKGEPKKCSEKIRKAQFIHPFAVSSQQSAVNRKQTEKRCRKILTIREKSWWSHSTDGDADKEEEEDGDGDGGDDADADEEEEEDEDEDEDDEDSTNGDEENDDGNDAFHQHRIRAYLNFTAKNTAVGMQTGPHTICVNKAGSNQNHTFSKCFFLGSVSYTPRKQTRDKKDNENHKNDNKDTLRIMTMIQKGKQWEWYWWWWWWWWWWRWRWRWCGRGGWWWW